jgi:hypothetical protein
MRLSPFTSSHTTIISRTFSSIVSQTKEPTYKMDSQGLSKTQEKKWKKAQKQAARMAQQNAAHGTPERADAHGDEQLAVMDSPAVSKWLRSNIPRTKDMDQSRTAAISAAVAAVAAASSSGYGSPQRPSNSRYFGLADASLEKQQHHEIYEHTTNTT